MSYANFKPTIWSKYIQTELEKECTLADWCNKKFEGEAKKGERVKIVGAGNPTISDYTPGVAINAPEAVPDASLFLDIDQAKYFNIAVDDIDKAQSIDGMMQALIKNGVRGLKEERDKYVGTLAKEATFIKAVTKVDEKADARSAVNAAILQLRENNVGTNMEVVIEIPWFVYQYFKDDLADVSTNNVELLKRGIVGMYDGCYIRPTNLLYMANESSADTWYCMARTHDAIAFASSIEKTEAYRPHDSFSDAVKSLSVYGAKIVRPEELCTFKVKK